MLRNYDLRKKIGACSYQEIKDELKTKDVKDSRCT